MKKIWLIALIVLKALYAENAMADGSKDVYSDVGAVEKAVANLFWKNFRLEPYASWSSVLTKRESESSGAQTGSGGEMFSGGAGEVFPGLDFSPGDLTLGARVFVPFLEGRFYTKGEFWEESFFESDFLKNHDWNFGVSITDGGLLKKTPFVVKVGHLGAGGAFTKINNPVLGTSVNPFYASVGSATAITANLPSSSSFSNPVSGFVQVSFGDKKEFFRTGTVNVFVRGLDFLESDERGGEGTASVSAENVSGAYAGSGGSDAASVSTENETGVDAGSGGTGSDFCLLGEENGLFWGGGTYAVSGLFKLVIPGVKKIKTSALNLGFAVGIFPFFNDDFYSEKSWFNKIRPFEDKSCLCGQLNALLSNSFYTGNVFLNVYQNPLSSVQFCVKNENKLVLGNFTFGFSSFINPFEQILTPSGKILQRQFQTKLNLNYSTFIRAFGFLFTEPIIRVKYGASFYSCFLEDGFSCKAGLGIQLMDSFFLFSLLGNATFEDNTFDSATATLKMNPSFGKFKPTFTQNLSWSKSSSALTTTQKSTVSFNLGNKNPFSSTCSLSASFTEKNGEFTKFVVDSALGMNFVWKGIKCTGKVTVKYY